MVTKSVIRVGYVLFFLTVGIVSAAEQSSVDAAALVLAKNSRGSETLYHDKELLTVKSLERTWYKEGLYWAAYLQNPFNRTHKLAKAIQFGDGEAIARMAIAPEDVDQGEHKTIVLKGGQLYSWYRDPLIDLLTLREQVDNDVFFSDEAQHTSLLANNLFDLLLSVRRITKEVDLHKQVFYSIERPKALGALFFAIDRIDIPLLKKVLAYSVNVNSRQEPFTEKSALAYAVLGFKKRSMGEGIDIIVKELIDHGALYDQSAMRAVAFVESMNVTVKDGFKRVKERLVKCSEIQGLTGTPSNVKIL